MMMFIFSFAVTAQALTTMMASSNSGKMTSHQRTDASKALVQKLKQMTTASEVASLLNGNQDLLNPFVVSTAMSKLRRYVYFCFIYYFCVCVM